jgi:hypothetical protein
VRAGGFARCPGPAAWNRSGVPGDQGQELPVLGREPSDMPTDAIPAWNSHGVLPPIDPADPVGFSRSPYRVSLADLVLRFNFSPARREILTGLLDFRAELHRHGLVTGFQWLNGSFLEDVEQLETRSPGDVDVVTFVPTMAFLSDEEIVADLDHGRLKGIFRVDAYFVVADELEWDGMIQWATYWYSMWSHRRTQVWKGYLRIDLAPAEDPAARGMLEAEPAGDVP